MNNPFKIPLIKYSKKFFNAGFRYFTADIQIQIKIIFGMAYSYNAILDNIAKNLI